MFLREQTQLMRSLQPLLDQPRLAVPLHTRAAFHSVLRLLTYFTAQRVQVWYFEEGGVVL